MGAYEIGHTVLNTSLHSELRINVDTLAGYPDELNPFLDDIESEASQLGVELLVPVPNSGVRLLGTRTWNGPKMIVPEKIARREFIISRGAGSCKGCCPSGNI